MDNTSVETQSISLSTEVETEGFDIQAGQTWIYPTNYPTRDYQYNIIQKALLKNTLVSLPTGLGKTFIAAVVMYNIYRWYPHGKIIFMAPTKPLVKQQVDACYNIMAIPPEVTAELTGAKVSSSRTNIWAEKRVFYVTPQVLQNDLNRIAELGPKIKCLVFDEAHRAKGNHAYCEVIRRLVAQNHKYFRVLALSATPGSNVNDVLEVIQNLLISHLEFRTEESLDVAPYVFQRSLETIVVPLGKKLEEVREEYLKILEQYVKTLIRFNVVQGNCASLTKGKIFMLMKEFQNRNRGASSSNYSEIMRCLNICVTLYHAFELLIRHGLRNFLSFYDEHIEKPLLRGNTQLRSILCNVREYLGPIPNIEVLPDGTYPEIPKDIVFGHPKYYKLRDVLVSHFNKADKNTRVIVFFEYRESVMEAHTLLLQSRPILKPKIFLGQGSGITQKVQLGVVKAFREGICNTLLSTCIGEEGLDVGEVDLIICFDISNKSPIRLVQRMGRTGRKREGRVVALVTEGREQQTLKDCLIHKNNISTYVLESKQLQTGMYSESPRLVPKNVTPRCEKMFITVKKIAKKSTIKDMLQSLSSNSSEPVFSSELDIVDIHERIPKATMFFNKGLALLKEKKLEENPIYYRFIEKQRSTQRTHKIKHSKYTNILTDLLCSADSKRFNIPTQIQSFTQGNPNKNFKQSDIRNMFFKKSSQQDFQSTQTSSQALEDIPTQIIIKEAENISDDLSISKELFSLISDYAFNQMKNPLTECKHCPHGFRCEDFAISTAPNIQTNNNWVPCDDILDTISLSDLENFSKIIDPTYKATDDRSMQIEASEFSQILENMDSQIFNNVNFTQLEKEAEINSEDINVEIEKSFNFEAPKTYCNLINKFGNSMFITQESIKVQKSDNNNSSKPSEITEEHLLEFFLLESLTDIYNDSASNSSQSTVIYSEDMSNKEINENDFYNGLRSPSPILSIAERKKKRERTVEGTKISLLQSEMSHSFNKDSSVKKIKTCNNLATSSNFDRLVSEVSDICDLSYFGITSNDFEKATTGNSTIAEISQICDLSQFGILPHSEGDQTKQNTNFSENLDKNISHVIRNSDKNAASVSKSISPTGVQTSINGNSFNSTVNLDNITSTFKKKCFQESPEFQTSVNDQVTTVQINTSEIDLPTQRTDFTKKCTNNEIKLNSTQLSNYINDSDDDDVFNLATQPNNFKDGNVDHVSKCFNKSFKISPIAQKTATQKSTPKRDSDQTLVDIDLDLLTPQIDFTKNCDNYLTKSDFTQKSNFVQDDEDSEAFFMPTQPNNSNKSKILTQKNIALENKKGKLNTSTFEKEIECIDLSSPPKTNDSSVLSHASQLSISQMLSFLNKTSQKENLKDETNISYVNRTQKARSPILSSSGKISQRLNLSTKKNVHKEESLLKIQPKNSLMKSGDPYVFSPSPKNSKKKSTEKESTSSDEFEDSMFVKPDISLIKAGKKVLAKNVENKTRPHKKKPNDFLDLEAQLSDDENILISDDEDEEDNDFYEKSFVNDETQNFDTQMHAKYLQSVRSPARPGRFKIPIKTAVNISNVYSQPPSTEMDTYLEDSFCVDNDIELSQENELSQLEILEKKLKQQKKRKISGEKKSSKPKRRRVICYDSDESD